MIDLHTHTDASDGVLAIEELAELAKNSGLSAIAITDHDTVASARRIKGLVSGIEIIPGIELSVYDDGLDYMDIHVLGLFIDAEDPDLLSTLRRLGHDREEQKKGIILRLNELGYEISYEEARAKAKGAFGRPHIAKALLERYPEEFGSIPEVFEKLLEQGKPAFMSRTSSFGLGEAIGMIHGAGGLAILAHPMAYRYDVRKLLSDFRSLGGDGIETYYDYASNYPRKGYTKEDNERLRSELQGMARELGLLESGGSDFHSPKKGAQLGGFGPPDDLLAKLKARVNNNKSDV